MVSLFSMVKCGALFNINIDIIFFFFRYNVETLSESLTIMSIIEENDGIW